LRKGASDIEDNIVPETSVASNYKSAFKAVSFSYVNSLNSGENGLSFSHQYLYWISCSYNGCWAWRWTAAA